MANSISLPTNSLRCANGLLLFRAPPLATRLRYVHRSAAAKIHRLHGPNSIIEVSTTTKAKHGKEIRRRLRDSRRTVTQYRAVIESYKRLNEANEGHITHLLNLLRRSEEAREEHITRFNKEIRGLRTRIEDWAERNPPISHRIGLLGGLLSFFGLLAPIVFLVDLAGGAFPVAACVDWCSLRKIDNTTLRTLEE